MTSVRAAQSAAHTGAVGTRLTQAAKLCAVLRRLLAGAVHSPQHDCGIGVVNV